MADIVTNIHQIKVTQRMITQNMFPVFQYIYTCIYSDKNIRTTMKNTIRKSQNHLE